LVIGAIASVVLLLAMSPSENRMKDTGGPGMIPFELTGGQGKADEILDEFPLLATTFASAKFVLLTIAFAYILAGLGMRLGGQAGLL